MYNLLDFINVAQLEVLGFKKEYQYFLFICIIVCLFSIIVKALITIISNKRYTYVLTYTMSSLIFITGSLFFTQNKQEIMMAMHAIVLFGIVFALYILYQLIKSQIKNV